jgi:hypothetical protein
MRAFLRILLFVIVGPPIGTLAMMLTSGVINLARTGRPDDLVFLFTQVFQSTMLVGMGYVMGAVPALVAGVVAAILPRFMKTGWAYRWWVTLSGAVASVVVVFAFIGPSSMGATPPSDLGNALSFMGMMAWIGAVAALCCTLIFDGLSRMSVRTRVPA